MSFFAPDISVELAVLPPISVLEREWLELETRSDASFFTSWSWIGCWLACIPAQIQPRILRATIGVEVVGLGVVVTRNFWRNRLLPIKGLFLNATGDPLFDEITIEHNGFLTDRSLQSVVVPQFFEYLASMDDDWDELHLDGVTDITGAKLPELSGMLVKQRQRCNYYVDLDEVRSKSGGYLSLLGQNTRYNIRRSNKEYAKYGAILLTVAENIDQAFEFFAGLKHLHQAYWQSRGLPGAFANVFFEAFHSTLIKTRFFSGEIQLIRVNVGAQTLGYLYNFIQRGIVYNYQSGFDYLICEKKNRPGLVIHSLAVEYNSSLGHREYDLLAGDSDYKLALSTRTGEMIWIVLQRDLFKLRFEEFLRRIKQFLSGRIKK